MISMSREADRCGLSDMEFRARLHEAGIGVGGNGAMWESAVKSLADKIARERRGRNPDDLAP
jgi:hypothetical protein